MPEQLFYGGSILTMDPTRPTPEAVYIKDGRIAGMGTLAATRAQAAPDAVEIDLQGGCLMPGFIDGHSHITQFANSLRFTPLSDVKSFDELAEALLRGRRERNLPEGSWLVGFGYDHNQLEEHRHPTRELLDQIAPDIPVLVSHASGHMGAANSRALEQAGITQNTPDPDGGKIGRDENGDPNGYLEENAFMVMGAAVPPASEAELLDLLVRAQKVYASYGITTVQDGLTKEPEFRMLQNAAEQGRLFLDTVGYADLKSAPDLLREHPEYAGGYRNRFRMGGYKIFLDGSPQGRTAWMTKPYLGDDPDYRGYPIYSNEAVSAFVETARKEGRQLLAHCNGDAAAEQFITAHQEHSSTRNVMIHAQLLRRDLLPAMKAAGIMPSYFVAHTWHWGDTHLKNLGKERAAYISPLQSTIDLGIPFTLHQDTPVLPPDMIDTLWCAVNRVTRDGVPLAQTEAVSTYDALKGMTLNGAYQYFEEREKGSIQLGKQADFTVLSQNPLAIPKRELRSLKVLATYKDGNCVFQA